jgi:catechol 2,3-dioxygenase-like lactoylglutathione lyase family enzyme
MIEGISAVTLGTHEMPRAVRFYCALGFEVLRGNAQSSFTSFRAGMSYLNLVALGLVGSRDLLRCRR